jgi:hypothetical protein
MSADAYVPNFMTTQLIPLKLTVKLTEFLMLSAQILDPPLGLWHKQSCNGKKYMYDGSRGMNKI